MFVARGSKPAPMVNGWVVTLLSRAHAPTDKWTNKSVVCSGVRHVERDSAPALVRFGVSGALVRLALKPVCLARLSWTNVLRAADRKDASVPQPANGAFHHARVRVNVRQASGGNPQKQRFV